MTLSSSSPSLFALWFGFVLFSRCHKLTSAWMTQSHRDCHSHHLPRRHLSPSSTARFYTDEKNPHIGTSREWLDRSLDYYSKVMRETEQQRRRLVQQSQAVEPSQQQEDKTNQCVDVTSSQGVSSLPPWKQRVHQDGYLIMAAKHYFALRKIKDGKPHHAELIYRRILTELQRQANGDEKECDHAKLAVTTLLLALLLQRLRSSPKDVRSVFLSFFSGGCGGIS